MTDDRATGQRARRVRFWTAMIVYCGAGWLAAELLMSAREIFRLPEFLDVVFTALFLAGLLATVLLLKTRVAAGGSPMLQALRAFAVALLLAGAALLASHWLLPAGAVEATSSVIVRPDLAGTFSDISG